jgi:hypothetical protein
LKLQGSSEKGESQATAYAAKGLSSKKGFAYKKGSSVSSESSGGGSGSSVSCYRCEGAHNFTECKVSKEMLDSIEHVFSQIVGVNKETLITLSILRVRLNG